MPHDTLTNIIKGYIDNNIIFGNDIIVRGWCFHIEKGTLPLRVKLPETFLYNIQIQTRKDVGEAYGRDDITICGWKFTYPKTVTSELQMNVDGQWYSVFRFESNTTDASSITLIESPPIQTEISSTELGLLNRTFEVDTTIDTNKPPTFIVVDNFYKNPNSIREFALKQEFNHHKEYHKGKRTEKQFKFNGLKERFEEIIGHKIKNWDKYGVNGVFQVCVAGDQLVYHVDTQQYAGVLFLTPDAPPGTGTSFYRSNHTKKMKISSDNEHNIVFKNGFLDSTEFELVDTVGNVFNRIVLFDAQLIHAATNYFGNNDENGRLFQIFFFDLDN